MFFVIGHRLCGYERYLMRENRGRFRIFALVPSTLSRAECDRLRRSGAAVLPSVEPSGNGLYKSFAYEIFKRRRDSVLLAFDGNSPAANLVQEAKNGPAAAPFLSTAPPGRCGPRHAASRAMCAAWTRRATPSARS